MSSILSKIGIVGASALVLSACAVVEGVDFEQDFSGDPVDVQTLETLDPFTQIDVSSGLAVVYTQSPETRVVIESYDGGFKNIEVLTRNGRLVVKRPNSNSWGRRMKKSRYLVRVSAPELSALEASSGSLFRAETLRGETFDLDVSSGASAEFGNMTVATIDVDLSSGASSRLAGSCDTIRVDASSGAAVSGREFRCANLIGEVSSGASVIGAADRAVRGEASSGGAIVVYGTPSDVTTSKSSGGSVTVQAG